MEEKTQFPKKKLDTTKSTLVLEGNKKERAKWKKRIEGFMENLKGDQAERKRINNIRFDFFTGDQSSYTNIVGLQRKEKKGHANAVFNYAGRTGLKIYYGLANNPPKINVPGIPMGEKFFGRESARAQGVEDFQDQVFFLNKFWVTTYRSAILNQIIAGDAAVMVYFDPDEKKIKINQKENMDNLLVGWNGEAGGYDFVIDVEKRSLISIENEFGIEVFPSAVQEEEMSKGTTPGSHVEGDEYGSKTKTATHTSILPSGKTNLPKAEVVKYWDDKRNVIVIAGEIVQFVEHDWGFNPWVLIKNIHVPRKVWSMSDLDFLIDPQIEYNEGSNDERDFIRAAVNLKYVVKNMNDFDPESIKTGSGQVIFISGDDVDFYALAQPVNTFPTDQYLNRVKKALHDLGVPEVSFGGGSGDSGRKAAIDYQSLVDVIQDKRNSWEDALLGISERIQVLGYKYFPKDFFKNPESKSFEVRPIEFNWAEIVPLTSAERNTNIINKLNANMISLRSALDEAGYKDVEQEIAKLKEEMQDPDLSVLRNRIRELFPGIREAARREQTEQQEQTGGEGGETAAATPTLVPAQNRGEAALPMAQPGSGRSFSTPGGFIERTRQNLEEAVSA